jgi:hypothetical protein
MADTHLTPERLREFLNYDAETGVFTRKRNNGTAKTGDVAGWLEPHGYIKISICGRRYYAHRCAILFVTGEWPRESVDHIDGNRANNAFANLRCVGQQTNMQNQKVAQSRNKTGYLGVCFSKAAGKYMAECKGDDGTRRYLGLFDTAEKAYNAYLKAKRQTQKGCTI